MEDLLPNAKNIPTGKQKINAKIEIINVSESPPQELVSTYFKPKLPPESKLIMMNGKINNKNITRYFLYFGGDINKRITNPINNTKVVFILQISVIGYIP